jgi:hypothetical protein
MGSNFNVKFRMIGPWKLEKEAESIMRNELYNVVKRSGGWVCKYHGLPYLRMMLTNDRLGDLYPRPFLHFWGHEYGALCLGRHLRLFCSLLWSTLSEH